MEVAKTFDRAGVRYRPGDALPEGLDRQTLEHYKRYGMVREVRTPGPAETKPAVPAKNTGAATRKRSAPNPEVNKNAGGAGDGSDTGAPDGKQPEGAGQPSAADGQQSASGVTGQQASDENSNDAGQKQD